MSNDIERFKKYLWTLMPAVNEFKSETVQIRVITRILNAFPEKEEIVSGRNFEPFNAKYPKDY